MALPLRLVGDAVIVIALFLYLYNLSFIAAPSISTGRVVLFGLAIAMWRQAWSALGEFGTANRVALFVSLLALFYSAVLFALTGGADFTQLSRCLHFLAFVMVGALLFSLIVGFDGCRFCGLFAAATAVQSFLIVFSYFSPEYREWLSGVLVQGGHIPLTSAMRAPGLSNSSGASLSVIQSLGVFAALYAARRSRSLYGSLVLVLVALLNCLSTVVVGRSGLLLSVCFLGLFILAGGKRVRQVAVVTILATVALAIALRPVVVDRLRRASPSFEVLSQWALEPFEHGTRGPFFEGFAAQPVPALSLTTVLGTGLVKASEFESASGSDSGYIQTYYALGLVVATVFYGGLLFGLLGSVQRTSEWPLLGPLVLGLFLAEIKEPFIFKYVYAFLTTALLFMSGQRHLNGSEVSVANECA